MGGGGGGRGQPWKVLDRGGLINPPSFQVTRQLGWQQCSGLWGRGELSQGGSCRSPYTAQV